MGRMTNPNRARNEVPISIPDITHLEDIDFRNKSVITTFANKTFAPDNTTNEAKFGPIGTPTGGANQMQRVHYNLQTGDMLELTLNIKGDPYWLGSSRRNRKGLQTGSASQDEKYADYQSG